MKNRKGFTLAELLGVIVILAVLAVIALPSVTNLISNNKSKLYDIQINNIKEGMEAYASYNVMSMPSNGTIYLTLYQLASENYIDYKIENPLTKKNFSLDTILIFNKPQYEVDVKSTDIFFTDEQLENLPKLILNRDYGPMLTDLTDNIKVATIDGSDSKSSVNITEIYSGVYLYTLEDTNNNISVSVIYNANY